MARAVWRGMAATPKEVCPSCGRIEPLLSIKDAAKIASVNRKTIYRWIRSSILPYRRLPSGAIRIRLGDLLQVPRKSRDARKTAAGGSPQDGEARAGGSAEPAKISGIYRSNE